MRKQVLAVLLVPALFGCSQVTNPGTSPQLIDFTHLQVGQESRYFLFTGSTGSDEVQYSGDVLTLTVKSKVTDERYILHETLSTGGKGTILGDAPRENDINLAFSDGTICMWGVSEGPLPNFFIPWTDGLANALPLAAVDGPQLDIHGMQAFPFCSTNCLGFVSRYRQLQYVYDHLNVIVDNSPMAYDGPGTTALYSAHDGVVRVSSYSGWTGKGIGWDLVPRGYRTPGL